MKKFDFDDEPTRREFLIQAAIAATSALVLPGVVGTAAAQTTNPTPPLTTLGQIASIKGSGKLQGVLKIGSGVRNIPGWTTRPMLRYFQGYNLQGPDKNKVWPPDPTVCLPGPTLKVKVGERVELTLINQVDVGQFGGSLDQAETGATDGCDHTTNATLETPDKNWYPDTRGDSYPNCFHGSSSANLHFHGTHVTPDGLGDNVLVNVRPDKNMSDEQALALVEPVFKYCEMHEGHMSWKAEELKSFREWQEKAVKDYDLHAIWKGKRGPNAEGKPELPEPNQLAPANDRAVAQGHWPQYFIGTFPNCFKVTEAAGHSMGQAPGTHWYHAHKHGSTAINLYNGLAGALIIEGDYDKELADIPNLKLIENQKIMVVQQFNDLPDLERPAARGPITFTNGTPVVAVTGGLQAGPNITLQPGEIQLWRIINAHVQVTINGAFTDSKGGTTNLPAFRQIAQDGVQFSLINYKNQPLTPNGKFTLAPGGRIDILVKAPAVAGTWQLAGVVNLTVAGNPVQPEQNFPTDEQFPKPPSFLDNIPKPTKGRTVTFGWEPYRVFTGPARSNRTHGKYDADPTKNPTLIELPKNDVWVNPKTKINIAANRGPYFTIDDEQFNEKHYYQTMVLGDTEEWTIYNMTALTHPFHIHVNPFQVVEIYDPNVSPNPVKYDNPVWFDVVNVPKAKTMLNAAINRNVVVLGEDNKAKDPGYVKFRTRFADFTGSYVLHCHILAHEDRGMMQLVRVIDSLTTLEHH